MAPSLSRSAPAAADLVGAGESGKGLEVQRAADGAGHDNASSQNAIGSPQRGSVPHEW